MMNAISQVSRVFRSTAVVFWLGVGTTANAELDTLQYISHDGIGFGRLDVNSATGKTITSSDGSISTNVSSEDRFTLLDIDGGDMWNGGDRFTYLYNEDKAIGDFTATVRVVAQTEAVSGRWGKAGITAQANLSGLGQQASAFVYTGTGSQKDPPAAGDHTAVPIYAEGRRDSDRTGGFQIPVTNASGEIINNVFPNPQDGSPNPPTNVSWLRLQYVADTNTFVTGYALDIGGRPGEWAYSPEIVDVRRPSLEEGEGWFVGVAYSAQNSFDLTNVSDLDGLHGVTFDSYSIRSGPACDSTTGGDIDGDGEVGFSDFVILAENFGQFVDGHTQGDIDCDGVVQLSDFIILSARYGTTTNATVTEVPEPSAIVLIGFAGAICCLGPRKSRQLR